MSAVAPPRSQNIVSAPRAFGPLTRSRLRRLGFVYLTVFACGLGLAHVAASPGTQAFGLGLAFPGGGFLHYLGGSAGGIAVHLACAVLTFILFIAGLILWFATGNQAAPVVVWLGGALAAGAMGHAHTFAGSWIVVSGLAAATAGGAWLGHRHLLAGKLARRERRAASIGTWVPPATPLDAAGRPLVEELDADDLAALRYALDRALQPVDEFNGFDFIDQFQPSAVRYQINNLGYALSFANYLRLPAMRGYLVDAQRRLIEKKKQHRVWKYWALESLWGNFRHEPNPMARDNVMYSGWYAAQIGLFEAATGDSSCAAPGALTLRATNGTEYVNDFHTLAATLAENERASEFCLFPCEPNWIYPLCNNQAAIGLRLHDRLHGTHYWDDVETHYRRRLEQEFIDVDGHLVPLRSTRTGLTIPGLQSCSEDAIPAFWMHPLFPDIAARWWEIARSELFRRGDGGLELLPLKPWLDAGNYRFNTAYALGALGMAARELGDDDAVRAIRGAIDELPTARHGGVLSYPGCSTWSHTFMLNMRIGRVNGLRDLVNEERPAAWRDGPYIEEAPYPGVLPARAVSDSAALEAVLYPGTGRGPVTIVLGGLRPGAGYHCEGALAETAAADAGGRLRVVVELDGRRELRVLPNA